jgi:ABC-type uncharacterized transport system auxiliary subunit
MRRLAWWTIFLACLAAGCVSAKSPRYYHLNLAPAAAQSNSAPFQASILVGRLTAPRILRDDRVIYGMSDVEMGVDEYHRWTEPPTEMVEDLLVQQLRRSGQYKSVQRISSTARGDYLLRGHLSSLNEVDDPAGIKARFSVQLELFEQKSGSVVWTGSYSHDEPVEKKSVTAVVESLEKSVNTGLEQLTANLAQYFASRRPQQ